MLSKRQIDQIRYDDPMPYDEAWKEIDRIQAKYPSLRNDLDKALHVVMAKTSVQRALKWLKAFENRYLKINDSFLTVESHDLAIKESAERLAGRCHRAFIEEIQTPNGHVKRSVEYRYKTAIRLVITLCKGMSVETPALPKPKDYNHDTVAAVMARLCNPKWWRRKIRTLQKEKLESACRRLGAVCKRRGGYCSDAGLRLHKSSKRRNKKILEEMEATNNEGQTYTLAELAELGVSNPVNRRNELMTRIRGTEEFAEQFPEFIPVFITQTCPSRFHSHHRSGEEYKKWNRSTPREAQAYLSEIWGNVRAKWNRESIYTFGYRVAEPHHDGCPHWHLLLWFHQDQLKHALSIYRDYALADSPNEPGAQQRRFTVKQDELAKGATGYIAKYISKNVDGLTADGKAWSANVVKTAERTEAWARTWRIRQFQSIGGPSVTVYRECRRLSKQSLLEQTEGIDNEQILSIHKAADDGDWCAYIKAMGGTSLSPNNMPLRAYMITKQEEDGQPATNQYGEAMEQLKGILLHTGRAVITRVYDWIIQPVSRLKDTDQDNTYHDESFYMEAHAPPLDLCQ